MKQFFTKIFLTIAAFSLFIGVAVVFYGVEAAEPDQEPAEEEISTVSFPIPELGNCGSQGECHDYCEDLEHASACIKYAKANDLLSEEDEKTLDEFSDVIENGGPGGCKTEESCGAYCEDTNNIKECLGFVKKHNLLNDDEIKEIEKAVDVIENGGPGGCTKEEECRIYCENIDNTEECVNFADKFNLVTSEELEEMRKMVAVKKAGVAFPGNCRTKESCLAYCDNSANAAECMEFGLKAGFIPEEDAETINKILPYLKSGGKMPGGCTTKEVCDSYCESDAHIDECVDFAVKAGFVAPDDAAIIRKVGGQSPGNCKSKTACDAYCKNAEHIDECVEFGVKAGFITAEEAENAKKFNLNSGPGGCTGRAECEAFCVVNQEECFNWAKEHGMDTQPGGQEECAKQGGSWDGKMCEMGASECAKQGGNWDGTTCIFPEGKFPGIECENPPCGPPEQSNIPTEGLGGPQKVFSGPGGCKTPDECKVYCMSNPQACQGSAPPGDGPGYQNPVENADQSHEECVKQGGIWNGSRCDFSVRECMNQGGAWDGTNCNFRDPTMQNQGIDRGSEECVKQGGSWTGSSCNFPPPPSPSSFRDYPFFGAIFRYLLK